MYFIFVGLFWLCSWVYMYMCIFHYFNYYLPNFVTAICLGFIFCFSFWIFVLISLKATTNHLWNLHSWPEIKPWAFVVGALTPRPLTTRELTLLLLLLLSRFSCVQLCATHRWQPTRLPPSLGFSRQEHWSGLPFPSPMHESEKGKWSRSVVSDP